MSERMSETGAERERRSFAARVSLLFAAIFVVAGTNLPYLPVWLDWAGLGPREIAIITATPLFVRVAVTPAIAFAADRAGDHRRFLIGLSWAGSPLWSCWRSRAGSGPILVCTVAFALAWTTVMPLTETVAMSGRQGRRPRLRPHAAVGLAQLHRRQPRRRLGGGAAGAAGSAIWLVVGGMALTTVARARPGAPHRARPPRRPRPARRACAIADAVGLLRSRVFLIFLVASGLACRPRTPCSTPSARCTGAPWACRPAWSGAAVGHLDRVPRWRCLPSRRAVVPRIGAGRS